MTKRTGTTRKKTRHIMRVPKAEKGKLNPARFLQKLKEGDKVVLKAAPAFHKGGYFRRFHGRTGDVISVKGSSCQVRIKDKNMYKEITVNPVHLRKAQK